MKLNKFYHLSGLCAAAAVLLLTGCSESNSANAEKESKAEEVAAKVETVTEEVVAKAEPKAEPVVVAEAKEAVEEVVEATPAVVAEASKEEPATEAAAPEATSGSDYTVKMVNKGADGEAMVFEPAFLKVEKGATVKFVAVDMAHDSVSTFTPEGATGWKGENSKDVVATLDVEGVYIYKCTPHEMMGMVGVIQVGEASNKAAAEEAAKKIAAGIIMNKDRLPAYIAKVE